MRYSKGYRQDNNGNRYKTTPRLTVPKLDMQDQYIQVTQTDRLDIIAQKYYGDKSLWYVIANANNVGKGTICIHKGTILRIPSRTGIASGDF